MDEFLWAFPTEFSVLLQHHFHQIFSLKQINLTGGPIIPFAAYSVYGGISVRFPSKFSSFGKGLQ